MTRDPSSSESGDLIREAMDWLTEGSSPKAAGSDVEPTMVDADETTSPNRTWDVVHEPIAEPDPTAGVMPPASSDLWSSIADTHVLEREHRPEPAPPSPSEPIAYEPVPPIDQQTDVSPKHRARNTGLVILARIAIGLAIFGGFAVYRNVTSEETVTVAEMAPGTCLQDPGPGLVGDAPLVDCDKPHDLEVFALVPLPFAEDAALPDEEILFDSAFDTCLPRFETYTGQDWDTSPYYLDAFVPDRHSWKSGDREAICFLFQVSSGGDLKTSTGSARRGSV